MPAITIRNVPESTRDELAARAARSGRSLQEYLRLLLVETASLPDMDTVLAHVATRKAATGSRLSAEQILGHRDADRR